MNSGAEAQLSADERLEWLRLIRSDNVGPRTFSALLHRYGSASKAVVALPRLAQQGGARAAVRVPSRRDAERELSAAATLGVRFVGWHEAEYPPRLKMIADPPPLIAVRGKTAALQQPIVAIVGARNASAAGMRFAEQLARELAAAGLVIASGLARGIDGAAHRAALPSGTVAVLAGGHDHVYPPEHADLAAAITATGALISEMPMGWEPRGRDFPRRNRIISGVAVGIVVVEAARRSGSLITARCALDQGREVFAVPGSPLDPRAEGSNALLKQGATLVTQAEDVLGVLRPILGRPVEPSAQEIDEAPAAAAEPADDDRARILGLLSPTPTPMDDLVRRSSTSPAVLRGVLLELELAGRLIRQGAQVALIG